MTDWSDITQEIRSSDLLVTSHTRAVLEALVVTVLWSSSYVLVKIGLAEIPALTFAGLRYGIAAAILFPVFLSRGHHRSLRQLGRHDLGALVLLGLLLYTLTQGAQFVALQYLRAATISLMLTFTPVLVAAFSIPLLSEQTSRRQWVAMGVLFIGVSIYFHPYDFGTATVLGLGVMGIGLLANAFASILGRYVNRGETLSALTVTMFSMGIGSAVLLGTGIAVQGLPSLSVQSWAIILWLAVINTAFAFTLWNHSLQCLSATESSVINNTMLVQVAAFGWVFLGETLRPLDRLGLALVMLGVLVVQVTGRK